MSSNSAVRLSSAPNSLQRKLGKLCADNTAAVARAQAAVNDLSGNFSAWLEEAVEKLEAAAKDVTQENLGDKPGEMLYRRAHDVKGVGASCKSQTTHRIASSLCRLLQQADIRAAAPLALVGAHINALRAVMRGQDDQDNAALADALAHELEAQVAKIESRLV